MSVWLAVIKCALAGVRFQEFGRASLVAHTLSEIFLTSVLEAGIVLGVLAVFLRTVRRTGWQVLALLATFALGVLWATFHIPEVRIFQPGLDTPTGWLAHIGVAGTLFAAGLLVSLPAGWGRSWLRWPATVGCLSLMAMAGCSRWTGREAGEESPPNVVLISLDTLRPDRLQSYGYERETSPEIQRFFEQGVRFQHAFAPDSFTLPSHMSLMTGLQPSRHGVVPERGLSSSIPTLAETLQDSHDTLAVVDGVTWLRPRFGFARGFDVYHPVEEGAESKVDQILELLDVVGSRSFFLFAHFYDAHSDFELQPYEAAPQDVERLASRYQGSFDWSVLEGLSASRYLQRLNEDGKALGPEERQHLSDLYDAGIATLDRQLGRLFHSLEERGLLENTWVFLTSDHGEEFYEHGKALHTQHYDEALRVPLLVRSPAGSFAVRAEPVQLMDLFPTVLEVCSTEPLDERPGNGLSLLPLIDQGTRPGSPFPQERELVADGKGRVLGVRTAEASLVRAEGSWHLFAPDDPEQRKDLVSEPSWQPVFDRLMARTRELQQAWRAERKSAAPDAELTAKERERLRGLGYVE